MKAKYLRSSLTAIFCIYTFCTSAQTMKVGLYRVDHHVYNISNYGHNHRLMVEENSNLISRIRTDSLSGIEFPEISSQENIKSAFVKVLGSARINQLIAEKYVLVLLYFDTRGKVQAVKYIINGNSDLTLKEIDRLTSFIKEKVSFEIPPEIIKDDKITIFSRLIRFRELTD